MAIAYLAFLGSIVAYLLWFHLLKVSGATAASAYHFIIPPLGMLFGWLLLGEPVALTDLAGIVPVELGIWLVTRPRRARAALLGAHPESPVPNRTAKFLLPHGEPLWGLWVVSIPPAAQAKNSFGPAGNHLTAPHRFFRRANNCFVSSWQRKLEWTASRWADAGPSVRRDQRVRLQGLQRSGEVAAVKPWWRET